jgi:hypothetical protein
MQNKIIGIVRNSKPRDSWRGIFKRMKIMTLFSQYIYIYIYIYIYTLLLFIINIKKKFFTNNKIHEHKARFNNNLHLPRVNLAKYEKGAYIAGIIYISPSL